MCTYFCSLPRELIFDISVLTGGHNLKSVSKLFEQWTCVQVLLMEEILKSGDLVLLRRMSHFGVINWMQPHLGAFALYAKNLATIKWLKSNGYAWNKCVCRVVAANGNLSILRWGQNTWLSMECVNMPCCGITWTFIYFEMARVSKLSVE
jgi:hypothetical protein